MKVSQSVDFHLQYHRANSKKNTLKTCELVLVDLLRDLANETLGQQCTSPGHMLLAARDE
ncbi:hypothetical protein [Desulfopila aestuarii]|uniref:Uncharacterized protein n=1 Tax=Desulfopila aestuarii DSM 18488 TaxID=1121416 RepID=A0A1M7YJH5_9BACT|nr:hypothetical protein [Desulfopila aestuarii]SHO52759.1 hypothetical protein SAMN02745220_04731 [Desulfopila aestuarii DSM 18488]